MAQATETVTFGYRTYQKASNGQWYRQCGKCMGTGQHWAQWVAQGTCFACLGSGVVGNPIAREALEAHAAKLAKAQAKREAKKEVERAAKAEEAFAAYQAQQAQEAEAEAARATEKAKFQYFGEVGQKVEFEATVKWRTLVETQYGYTTLVTVEVTPGVEVKMFTTAQWVDEVEPGMKVTLKATIKAHEEYEGKKGTLVTRPKRVA